MGGFGEKRRIMKGKLSYKQQAYQNFIDKKGEFYASNSPILRKEFEELWREIRAYSRQEKKFGLNQYNIQKNTKIMFNEYLDFGSSKYKSYLKKRNVDISFEEKYKFAMKDSYLGRTQKFFEKYGDREFDGVLLNEWFQRFWNEIITKDELNKIIEEFQEGDPDYQKQEYHAKKSVNQDIDKYGAK